MLEIKTEIVIEANLENVWKTLTNFNDYKNWNSFITDISGSLTEGSVLSVHINPPGEKDGLLRYCPAKNTRSIKMKCYLSI